MGESSKSKWTVSEDVPGKPGRVAGLPPVFQPDRGIEEHGGKEETGWERIWRAV